MSPCKGQSALLQGPLVRCVCSRTQLLPHVQTYQIHGRERGDLYAHAPPCHTPEVGQQPEEPRAHALYPFKSPYPLPWAVDAPACFRVRRVTKWLSQSTLNAQKEPYFGQGSAELVGNDGFVSNMHVPSTVHLSTC
jgi:hypothetical protein